MVFEEGIWTDVLADAFCAFKVSRPSQGMGKRILCAFF
jgi:hypothetical protein